MYMANCKIKLTGLTLTDSCQRSIETIMQNLANKSPSDSFLQLSVDSGECNVNAFLSITSKSGKFHSSICGNEPLLVVKQLSKDLHNQIKSWIAKRVF